MIGGSGEDLSFQFSISFISMKTRLINQSIAFMLLITKLNQNTSTACKLGCVVHLDSLNVFMSSENSMFLAFSLMLNDLTSEHAVEFEIVFFKYSFTLVFHKANEKLRKWKNIQSLPRMQIYNRCQARKNMQKAPNTGNASPGIQLRISFGFMSKV